MQKKIAGKPPPAQVIMERTFGTACMVLNNIANIPFPELTRELFFSWNWPGQIQRDSSLVSIPSTMTLLQKCGRIKPFLSFSTS